MIYRYLVILLFSIQLNAFAQSSENTNHFNALIRDETGDLNNDKIDDQVMVLMDTVDATRPLLLQVFLSQPNKKLKLAITSDKAIEPMYPKDKNGKHNGFQIPSFIIEDGLLKMRSEINNGNITYEFKYQKGNFELLKVTKFSHDAVVAFTEKTIFTDTIYDLITGIKTETISLPYPKKEIKKQKKTAPKPLPKLQDFKYSDKEVY